MAELPKNVVKSRSDLEFKRRARSITALVLCVLVLLPMLRIGYIMIAHGGEYRKEAQQNQLYDTEIPAVRGTCDRRFGVDPYRFARRPV